MDRRTLLITVNLAIGILSIFMLIDTFAIIELPANLHYWLHGVYFGVVAMGLILFIVSKAQSRSASSKRVRN